MNVKELCNMIELPLDIQDAVLNFDKNFDYENVSVSMNKLFSRDTWNDGREELKSQLGDDSKGIRILACMLKCSLNTYDNYVIKGIDKKIFIDTLKCFTRFINEHYISYGDYAFDRDWWTARQISMNLFRIGELEYEMTNRDDEKVISIHIPSDADITSKNLRGSYDMAKEFFGKYFKDYSNVKMVCSSWLLSPNLNKVLDNDSKILQFQKSFTITNMNVNANEYVEWIFKNPNLAINEFPEDTKLQRKLKKYLLQGGKIGEAFGYLIENPFSY